MTVGLRISCILGIILIFKIKIFYFKVSLFNNSTYLYNNTSYNRVPSYKWILKA